MLDTAKDFARRLLEKYGITQPMAPEEPERPALFVEATYPAYFDNVAKSDDVPRVGYRSSLATEAGRKSAAAPILYVAQPYLFDMGPLSPLPPCDRGGSE